jgi:hypothetical protein
MLKTIDELPADGTLAAGLPRVSARPAGSSQGDVQQVTFGWKGPWY